MGIFAKLNFRAVDAACNDVAALLFVANLSMQCKSGIEHLHQAVDLKVVASRIVDEHASNCITVPTSGMRRAAALSQLSRIAAAIIRELEAKVGPRPTVQELCATLDKGFDVIAERVLDSARRGYLNLSPSEAQYFVRELKLLMLDLNAHTQAVFHAIDVFQRLDRMSLGAPASDRETQVSTTSIGPPNITGRELARGTPKEKPAQPRLDSLKPIASRDRADGAAPNQLSITKKTVIREIDRRPRNREHAGILDHDSNAAKTRETPSSPHSQPSRPKAPNVRDEPTGPPQALRTSFCSPVTIESPSRAIRGEKLVEDVGLVTSSGDFIAILDKFSWLPHSRTSPIALATPTEEPVTVTFARRRSAFSPECTPLGTFLLTGFSGDKAVQNALEIRVSAEDSELYFDVRDAAGSHLTITRRS